MERRFGRESKAANLVVAEKDGVQVRITRKSFEGAYREAGYTLVNGELLEASQSVMANIAGKAAGFAGLGALPVAELRALAKSRGVVGADRMKKVDLIAAIDGGDDTPADELPSDAPASDAPAIKPSQGTQETDWGVEEERALQGTQEGGGEDG
jgi:hypothetical protein